MKCGRCGQPGHNVRTCPGVFSQHHKGSVPVYQYTMPEHVTVPYSYTGPAVCGRCQPAGLPSTFFKMPGKRTCDRGHPLHVGVVAGGMILYS